jgi:anion-transporting  ArsA/GET3 family ATPase
MPKIIRKHLRAGAKVFEGLDKIGGQLSGRRSIADIMDEWIQASERISLFMKTRATFIIVANPEEIVVRQVARIIKTLRDYRMNIHGVVINRVIMNADSAILRGMKEAQEGCISELRKLAGELPIAELPLSASGMKGKRSLHPLGEKLLKELNLLKVQR